LKIENLLLNIMTISQSLKLTIDKLTAKNIDIPHLEAEILLSGILKKPREFLLAHGECELTKLQIANCKLQIKKRLKGLPLTYITGEKEFYGLKFKVNKNVLIPRPETELMVEEALKLATSGSQPITLVDVGTGSGCIIIVLAKLTDNKSRIRNQKLIGIDISARALTVAKQNAKLHGVAKNIKFIKGNLLSPIIRNSLFIIPDSSLIILANLPYGWKAWKNNSSMDTIGLKFEPHIALYTSKNGLGLYEKLFKQVKKLRVRSAGWRSELRDIYALCEFDPRQTAKVKQLIKRELPEATLQTKKDLAGLNRLVIIKIPSP
jgi:release factor glutamine methyltransferase